MKKRVLALALAAIFAVSCVGCGSQKAAEDDKKIVIGVTPVPHKDITEVAAKLLEEKGYEVKIVEYTDYVQPNTALEEGELDANYFQTLGYMDGQNAERDMHLVSVASIHAEPMGIYSKSIADLTSLPDGATIAVPNDEDNEDRALRVLAETGLIAVPEEGKITPADITENPHNFQFTEIEAGGLPRMLEDVDVAIINGNYALEADLGNTSNVLYIEEIVGEKITLRGNVIAVKDGTQDSQKVKDIIEAFQSDEVRNYINETYAGAVIPVF
ncbi:MetQ/NlpA family ABC transporter substrate-binding protein [Acetivibrio ethanolgignens]|uniref:Lipoprotein n=1 Tax=Acetivibrio ethanolgignens TaxID=290052 RepID=A0A0V8QGG3_9FIRM|nr:MetQ/NlpA family ABC transporter substrate-binding protein [Acetivibrio ethanolgignens]KSV59707.1 hypothetical protein ASU35_08115 [Acetivibrio ethanolgignens]